MSKTIREYRCLLISPGDLSSARDEVPKVAGDWNAHIGKALGGRIEVVRYESHSVPDARMPPQDVLNEQIVDDCDFGVALFRSRLGTPTETSESGSVEEIQRLLTRGVPVGVYFSTESIPIDEIDPTEMERLQLFKSKIKDRALLGQFENLHSLREQLLLHLTNWVSQFLARDSGSPIAAPGQVLTAPVPDVVVLPYIGVTVPDRERRQYLAVDVRNRAPVSVFLTNISLELRDGKRLMAFRDALTGEGQGRREIRSGDHHTLYMDAREMLEGHDPGEFTCVVAVDAVGRQYRSTEESLREALSKVRGT